MEHGEVGEREVNVAIRQDEVDRRDRRILGRQHTQRDHADTAAAVVGEHPELLAGSLHRFSLVVVAVALVLAGLYTAFVRGATKG